MSDWMTLLNDAVGRFGRKAVAERLGYSQTTLSLVLSGKYPGGTEQVAKRVVGTFGQVACPYLGEALPTPTCRSLREQSPPTHNPARMRHWNACQNCPLNPARRNHE